MEIPMSTAISTTRGSRNAAARRSTQRRRQLFFELLEARQLLSDVTWDGGGDGTQWSDRFNWSGDQLPGAADDVNINVAANPSIFVSSGTHSIKSLHSAEALTLSGGSLQVSGTVQVDNAFKLSGGTLRNA